MAPNITPHPWTKAIPESRDRLQSRIIVWIAVPLLGCFAVLAIRDLLHTGDQAHAELIRSLGISFLFTLVAWRLRAATPFAAICGGIICTLVLENHQRLYAIAVLSHLKEPQPSIFNSPLVPLILLFVLTLVATRLGRKRKDSAGLAENRRGRNAAQVIANLGIAGMLGSYWSLYLFYAITKSPPMGGEVHSVVGYSVIFLVPTLAALTEATADTVSSEIGQAFGGTPILLTTLRRVPPGTDGAITLLGTFAGILAAAIIAITGIPALGMSLAECAIAFTAGVAGLFFDSLLGATAERRGWLGNDLVNFLSTAFAAAVALLTIRYAQNTLLAFN